MKVTFMPRESLQIDEARIIYRNFEGLGSKFNREGDRNFALLIDDEDIAEELKDRGWNVKIKDAREDGDMPFMFMPVKIKFNNRGPNIYLVTGNRQNRLDEESVAILDEINIISVDLDIRPYDWEANGKSGRAAYLEAMRVYQRVDRFNND